MSTVTLIGTTTDPYAGLSNEELFEVVDGKIIERPPVGSYSVELASIRQSCLGPFVREASLGRSIIEILLRINPSKIYPPDLVFISDQSWPISRRSPKKRP